MVYVQEILMVVAGAVSAGLLCYIIWYLIGIL